MLTDEQFETWADGKPVYTMDSIDIWRAAYDLGHKAGQEAMRERAALTAEAEADDGWQWDIVTSIRDLPIEEPK